MPHLLHIDASIRAEGSVSRQVAATFRESWTGTVTHRDLGREPLPHLAEPVVASRFVPAEVHTPEQRAGAGLQEALLEELLAADAYLFAVPMYNYGVPSAFKAWVDHIFIVGRTVGVAGSPLVGRPATLVLSRGGAYGPGTPKEGWDFAEPYLTRVLAHSLGFDLRIIMAELTAADTAPGMEGLRDKAAASLARAHDEARRQVGGLAAA